MRFLKKPDQNDKNQYRPITYMSLPAERGRLSELNSLGDVNTSVNRSYSHFPAESDRLKDALQSMYLPE